MSKIKFNKLPCVEVKGNFPVFQGWTSICNQILSDCSKLKKSSPLIAVEYYQGVLEENTTENLVEGLKPVLVIKTCDLMWPEDKNKAMVYPDVTDDRIFGYMTRLTIEAYFDPEKTENAQKEIASVSDGLVLIVGSGAAYVYTMPDVLVYADMARWEVQLRMRTHEVDNLGVNNRDTTDWMLLYKQGFFVDWRVLDRWKKKTMRRWDYVLDTNNRYEPKLVAGKGVLEGMNQVTKRPFSVVPFFDPGPWGGQWMKHYCNLDPNEKNYAWCFNCVPEENSLLLKFGDVIVEIQSINLVFYKPQEVMGAAVHGRFGDDYGGNAR